MQVDITPLVLLVADEERENIVGGLLLKPEGCLIQFKYERAL